MKTARFFVLVLLGCIGLWAASAPEDGLLLYVSFENGVTADVAQGNGKPIQSKGAEITPDGKYGNGYIQKTPGSLKYGAPGNINPQAGTVAAWIKPVNWNGTEEKFRYFFSIGGVQREGYSNLQLYKYYHLAGLQLLVRKPGVEGKFEVFDTQFFPTWKPGEWHHIAITWSKIDQQCIIYCDGQPTRGDYNDDVFPETIAELVEGLNFNCLPTADQFDDPSQLTIMDEIYVYDHPLGEAGISLLMQAGAKELSAAPAGTIPKVNNIPVIDGIMSDGEYADFFSTNTFVEYGNMGFYPRESQGFLGYDAENLYVCFRTRTKGGDANIEIMAQRHERDEDIWLDDAVEVLIQSPDGKFTQLVINSINTIYDSQNGDKAFDGDFTVANLIEGYWWVCEVKIPFAELGTQPPKPGEQWKINLGRDWKNPLNFSSLTDTCSFSNVSDMPVWTFGDDCGTADCRLDIDAVQAKTINFSGELKPSTISQTASAKIFAITADGQREDIANLDITPSSDANVPFALSFNADKLNGAKYQNKIGLTLQRGDGATLFDAFYNLRSFPPMTLQASILNLSHEFLCTIDISGLQASLSNIQLELQFKENGQIVSQKQLNNLNTRILKEKFAPSVWNTENRCVLNVRAINLKDQTVMVEQEMDFAIPEREDWQDCQKGLEHTVPQPWTPIVRQDNTIDIWNRTYVIGAAGMPAKMVSGGVNLLAKEMELSLKDANGNSIPFANLTFADTEYPDEVRFSAQAVAEDFTADLQGRVEFDGFCWYDLTLTPTSENANIAELYLEYCMPEKEVLFLLSSPYGTGYADLHAPQSQTKSFPYIRQLLFGNDERSLAWFAESDEFYRPETHPTPIQTWEEQGIRHAKVTMISELSRLDKTFKYGFGFSATPLKPMPENWQNMIAYYNGKFQSQITIFHVWSWSRWYGFMRPISDEEFREHFAYLKKTYPTSYRQPYLCQYLLSMISPEYKLYSEEWTCLPRCEMMEFGPRYPGKSVCACLGSDSYRSFWIDSFDKFLQDYPDVNGCYWDSIDPVTCENPLHGHGWTDLNGKVHPTNDILHYRDFYKRCYKIMKQQRPDSLITGHCSQRRELSTVGFCDIAYDGEQFVSNVSGNPDYCSFLTALYCRAFFGTQIGLVPLVMPAYYNNEEMATTTTAPTESLMTNALVYNFLVHSHRMNNDVFDEVQSITRPFNLAEAEYIPPYSEKIQQFITIKAPANSDIRPAIYRKTDGHQLIVIGNFKPEKVEISLRLTGTGKITEKRKNKVLQEHNGEIKISVPGSNFLILER